MPESNPATTRDESKQHSELVERVLSPDLRRRSESFVDGPMTKNWLAEQAFVLAEHARSLEEQLEAALSFLSNINENADEALLRMRLDRAREALSGSPAGIGVATRLGGASSPAGDSNPAGEPS